MRRTAVQGLVTIGTLGMLAILAGCGDDPTNPQANLVTLTVTVQEVHVIAECEGTTGVNPGDFTFELLFYGSDPAVAEQRYTGGFSGLNGQTVDIADIVITVEREPKENELFILEFGVTEWDNGVPDPGMNDSRGAGEYSWPTGHTATEIYTQVVSGSTRCRVMFVYTIGASGPGAATATTGSATEPRRIDRARGS